MADAYGSAAHRSAWEADTGQFGGATRIAGGWKGSMLDQAYASDGNKWVQPATAPAASTPVAPAQTTPSQTVGSSTYYNAPNGGSTTTPPAGQAPATPPPSLASMAQSPTTAAAPQPAAQLNDQFHRYANGQQFYATGANDGGWSATETDYSKQGAAAPTSAPKSAAPAQPAAQAPAAASQTPYTSYYATDSSGNKVYKDQNGAFSNSAPVGSAEYGQPQTPGIAPGQPGNSADTAKSIPSNLTSNAAYGAGTLAGTPYQAPAAANNPLYANNPGGNPAVAQQQAADATKTAQFADAAKQAQQIAATPVATPAPPATPPPSLASMAQSPTSGSFKAAVAPNTMEVNSQIDPNAQYQDPNGFQWTSATGLGTNSLDMAKAGVAQATAAGLTGQGGGYTPRAGDPTVDANGVWHTKDGGQLTLNPQSIAYMKSTGQIPQDWQPPAQPGTQYANATPAVTHAPGNLSPNDPTWTAHYDQTYQTMLQEPGMTPAFLDSPYGRNLLADRARNGMPASPVSAGQTALDHPNATSSSPIYNPAPSPSATGQPYTPTGQSPLSAPTLASMAPGGTVPTPVPNPVTPAVTPAASNPVPASAGGVTSGLSTAGLPGSGGNYLGDQATLALMMANYGGSVTNQFNNRANPWAEGDQQLVDRNAKAVADSRAQTTQAAEQMRQSRITQGMDTSGLNAEDARNVALGGAATLSGMLNQNRVEDYDKRAAWDTQNRTLSQGADQANFNDVLGMQGNDRGNWQALESQRQFNATLDDQQKWRAATTNAAMWDNLSKMAVSAIGVGAQAPAAQEALKAIFGKGQYVDASGKTVNDTGLLGKGLNGEDIGNGVGEAALTAISLVPGAGPIVSALARAMGLGKLAGSIGKGIGNAVAGNDANGNPQAPALPDANGLNNAPLNTGTDPLGPMQTPPLIPPATFGTLNFGQKSMASMAQNGPPLVVSKASPNEDPHAWIQRNAQANGMSVEQFEMAVANGAQSNNIQVA